MNFGLPTHVDDRHQAYGNGAVESACRIYKCSAVYSQVAVGWVALGRIALEQEVPKRLQVERSSQWLKHEVHLVQVGINH